MVKTYKFDVAGEILIAAGDRTLYWPAQQSLFATDLHAGKATHMRLQGVPIPDGNLSDDLTRLSAAIERTGARRLIFLGDLFHSEYNSEWDVFTKWCCTQDCSIELVRGNHDRFLTDKQLSDATITVHQESYKMAPFILRHHPLENVPARTYVLCGHVHPVRHIFGGGDHMRLPCFWQQSAQLILPAFGSFTGGYDVTKEVHQRMICCAPDFESLVILPAK